MAHISYRANLSAAIFPLTYNNVGGTVIVPQSDNNYDRRVDPAGEQKTAGIPQAIFLENVLPTEYGYQSVGYQDLPAITLGTGETIDFAYLANNGFVAARTTAPTPQWYLNSEANEFASAWQLSTTGATSLWNDTYWDTAFAFGAYYAMFPSTGLANVTEGGNPLGPWQHVVLSTPTSGFDFGPPGPAYGSDLIIASHNYLIGINRFSGKVQWSSTTSPTDFTPSLVSGAGSIVPNDFKSEIVAVRMTAAGFIMYCKKNAISATYTGNARYPWKFREVPDSHGYLAKTDITVSKGAGVHYAIDSQKTLRAITPENAQPIGPEVSTWLRGATRLEYWDSVNNQVLGASIGGAKLNTWIRYVLNRYIFLSYKSSGSPSTAEFSYILVYDTLLQRYGRLKVEHTYIFESQGVVYTLSKYGQCKRMIFGMAVTSGTHDSTLVLGKFQYVRSRHLDLHNVRTEHGPDSNYAVGVISSLDGATAGTYQALTASTLGAGINEYDCRLTGMNHQIVIRGKFDLNTLSLTFSPGAGR